MSTTETSDDRPLSRLAEAFHALGGTAAESPALPMRLEAFVRACRTMLNLFSFLGPESDFWKADYLERVEDLDKASRTVSTLDDLIEQDRANGCVRTAGSHTRNLLRLNRAIHLTKVLFELLLSTQGDSFDGPYFLAYASVFSRYHAKSVQSTVTDSIGGFPVKSKSGMFRMMNETPESSKVQMQKHIAGSGQVVDYVDQLFISKCLGIDW